MALAAIRVRNGEIVQRAGRAADVSVTPAVDGFVLHGAAGPAPDTWVQSPDDALIGWSQEAEGIRIWTTHPEPTIRFVPDIVLGPEDEPLPAPDWSRVLSVGDVQDRVMEQRAAEKATAIAQMQAVDSVLDTLPDEDVEALTYLYPKWEPGLDVALNDKLRHEGILYKTIQPHTTQADWAPPQVPNLFVRFREPTGGVMKWVAGEQVNVGDQRIYQGTTYSALQAHTTQAGWEPPNVPALWSPA